MELVLEEKLHIFQIYAPVEGRNKTENNKFYKILQTTLDEIREEGNHIIIMSD